MMAEVCHTNTAPTMAEMCGVNTVAGVENSFQMSSPSLQIASVGSVLIPTMLSSTGNLRQIGVSLPVTDCHKMQTLEEQMPPQEEANLEVLSNAAAAAADRVDLQDSHLLPSLLENLWQQRLANRFCSIQFSLGDRIYSAHRCVLCAASPYFNIQFKAGVDTSDELETVTVYCDEHKIFELVLRYMYTGTITVDTSNVRTILHLACSFQLTQLRDHCCTFLQTTMMPSSCLSIKDLAEQFSLTGLTRAAESFLMANITQIVKEREIQAFSWQRIVNFLSNRTLPLREEHKLELILHWVIEDPDQRHTKMPQLLSALRWESLPVRVAHNVLQAAPLLSSHRHSLVHVLEAMHERKVLHEEYVKRLTTIREEMRREAVTSDCDIEDDDVNLAASDDIQRNSDSLQNDSLRDDSLQNDGGSLHNDSLQNDDENLQNNISDNCEDSHSPNTNIKCEEEITDRVRGIKHEFSSEDTVDYNEKSDDTSSRMSTRASIRSAVKKQKGKRKKLLKKVPAKKESKVKKSKRSRKAKMPKKYVEIVPLDDDDGVTFTCNLCEFSSGWNKGYYRHMKSHFSGPPFYCDFTGCKHSAERIQPLLVHRMMHTDERPYPCPICNITFRTKNNMLTHLRCHTGDKPFVCTDCKRTFATKGTLQQHSVTHSESRPYLCDNCGFSTKYQSHLISHKRIHTGDVFHCQQAGCNYQTPKRSQLACHMRSHMSIRSHICSTCGRGFIERSHLVRHERIHLTDKPFKCDQCDYSSTRRDKLKDHVDKYHGDEMASKPYKARRPRRQTYNANSFPGVTHLTRNEKITMNNENDTMGEVTKCPTSSRQYSSQAMDEGILSMIENQSVTNDMLVTPHVPNRSNDMLVTPHLPNQSNDMLVTPHVPNRSNDMLVTPHVPNQSNDMLVTPHVPNQSNDMLVTPHVPNQSNDMLVTPHVPSQSMASQAMTGQIPVPTMTSQSVTSQMPVKTILSQSMTSQIPEKTTESQIRTLQTSSSLTLQKPAQNMASQSVTSHSASHNMTFQSVTSQLPLKTLGSKSMTSQIPSKTMTSQLVVSSMAAQLPQQSVTSKSPAQSMPLQLVPSHMPGKSMLSQLVPSHMPGKSMLSQLIPSHMPAKTIPSELVPSDMPSKSMSSELVLSHTPAKSMQSQLVPSHMPTQTMASQLITSHMPTHTMPSQLLTSHSSSRTMTSQSAPILSQVLAESYKKPPVTMAECSVSTSSELTRATPLQSSIPAYNTVDTHVLRRLIADPNVTLLVPYTPGTNLTSPLVNSDVSVATKQLSSVSNSSGLVYTQPGQGVLLIPNQQATQSGNVTTPMQSLQPVHPEACLITVTPQEALANTNHQHEEFNTLLNIL